MINKDLATFIAEQRALSVSDADISSALIGRGWNANEVREGLTGSPLAPQAPLPPVLSLLSDSLAQYRARFMLYFLVFLPSAIVSVALSLVIEPTVPRSPDISVLFLLAIGVFLTVFLSLISTVAAVLIAADETLASPVTAWQRALPHILPYFVTSFLVGLWVLGGTLLLIIPGIIVAVWYMFATLVTVIEGKSARESLRISKGYVTGRWVSVAWRILGGVFILIVISALVEGLISPLSLLEGGSVIKEALSSLFGIVVGGIATIYNYLLYLAVKR